MGQIIHLSLKPQIVNECPWCVEWAAKVEAPNYDLARVLWRKLYRNHLLKCKNDGGKFDGPNRFDVLKWFWEPIKNEQ